MLTLMRHGQASFGAAFYDRLSPLGMAQARAAGAFVQAQSRRFDLVCIGPRERHRDTAQGLIAGWGGQPECRPAPELDEFADTSELLASPGSADPADGRTNARNDVQRLLRRIGAWADGDFSLPDGPTLREFRRRTGQWARRQLEEDQGQGADGGPRRTLAVTSAGVVAAVLCEVLDLPDSHFVPLVSQVRNGSFTELMLWRSRPVLVSFNGTAHLPSGLLSAI